MKRSVILSNNELCLLANINSIFKHNRQILTYGMMNKRCFKCFQAKRLEIVTESMSTNLQLTDFSLLP